MADIKIDWLSDSSDCECCGWSYADGAIVTIGDEKIIDMTPAAHCFGGADYDRDTVFRAILAHLGHTTTETQNGD